MQGVARIEHNDDSRPMTHCNKPVNILGSFELLVEIAGQRIWASTDHSVI